MKPLSALLVVVAVSALLCAYAATSYSSTDYIGRGVSLGLTDPDGSVYQNGEPIRLLVETDTEGYAAVFNIDTDGYVHLLYPRDARSIRKFSPGREYGIPERDDEALIVSGNRGMELVFAVFVPRRGDFDVDALAREIRDVERGNTRRINEDPFIAANRIAARLVPDIASNAGASMAFTYFHVGEPVDFPRYLCRNCEETGRDPWGPDGPDYVAARDFEQTNQLAYPLARGFDLESNLAQPEPRREYIETTRTIYVDYRPGWDRGYYWGPWGYACYPYYPGWYVSIGYGWRWGHGWGHHYGHYYPWYPVARSGYYHYKRPNSIAYRTAARSSLPSRYRTSRPSGMRVKSRSDGFYTRPGARHVVKKPVRSVTRGRSVISRRSMASKHYRGDRSVYAPRTIKRTDRGYFNKRRSAYEREIRSIYRPGTSQRPVRSWRNDARGSRERMKSPRPIRTRSSTPKVRSGSTRSRPAARPATKTAPRSSRSATTRTSKSRKR